MAKERRVARGFGDVSHRLTFFCFLGIYCIEFVSQVVCSMEPGSSEEHDILKNLKKSRYCSHGSYAWVWKETTGVKLACCVTPTLILKFRFFFFLI